MDTSYALAYVLAMFVALATIFIAFKIRQLSARGFEDSYMWFIVTGNAISLVDVLVNILAPLLLPAAARSVMSRVSELYVLVLVPLSAVNAYLFLLFCMGLMARKLSRRTKLAYLISVTCFFVAFILAEARMLSGGDPRLAYFFMRLFQWGTAVFFCWVVVWIFVQHRKITRPADRRMARTVAILYAIGLSFCLAAVLIQQRFWRESWGALVRPAAFLLYNVPSLLYLFFASKKSSIASIAASTGRISGRVDFSRYGLTKREAEVLELIVGGMTNPDIAKRLFIASRTVDTHVQSIYRKLGVNSRVQLLRLFLMEKS